MPWRGTLLSLLAAILVHASMPAQHPVGEHPTHEVCTPFTALARFQQDDGSFLAPDAPAGRERAVAVTAWMVLALTGEGNTLRTGPDQDMLRQAVAWLRSRLDDGGWFVPPASPTSLADQTLATLAMAEACLAAKYAILRQPVSAGVATLAKILSGPQTKPPRAEELLLLHLLLRTTGEAQLANVGDAQTLRLPDEHRKLAAALAGLRPAPPDAPRQLAAELALRQCRGEALAAELADRAWPRDLATDPLHTFHASVLHQRRGDAAWRQECSRLKEVILAQVSNGDDRGTWEPAGEVGAALGRCGATAVHLLTQQLYYRYCQLSCLRGQ